MIPRSFYNTAQSPRIYSTPPGGSDICRYEWRTPVGGGLGVHLGYDSNDKPRYCAGVFLYVPAALTTPTR